MPDCSAVGHGSKNCQFAPADGPQYWRATPTLRRPCVSCASATSGIRPDTPKTNGKSLPRTRSGVERFVQTSLREWAYAGAYDRSDQRRGERQAFLFRYDWQRTHVGIDAETPIRRLGLSEDNLLTLRI